MTGLRIAVLFALLAVFGCRAIAGVRPSRAVEGEAADIRDAPWLVQLIEKDNTTGAVSSTCAGALVNTHQVVTAAHCFTLGSPELADPLGHYRVRVGATNKDKGGTVVFVKSIAMHPKFTKGDSHDVAVVTLVRRLKLSDTVKPIQLIGANKKVAAGTVVETGGWGRDKADAVSYAPTLKTLEMSKKSHAECRAIIQTTEMYNLHNAAYFCLAPETGIPCSGDSGTAAWMYDQMGMPQLVGVLKGGIACVFEDSGVSFYVDVNYKAVRKFLDKHIKRW